MEEFLVLVSPKKWIFLFLFWILDGLYVTDDFGSTTTYLITPLWPCYFVFHLLLCHPRKRSNHIPWRKFSKMNHLSYFHLVIKNQWDPAQQHSWCLIDPSIFVCSLPDRWNLLCFDLHFVYLDILELFLWLLEVLSEDSCILVRYRF